MSQAAVASRSSICLDKRHLACAVASRIMVSSARAVTGWVLALLPPSSCDRRSEYFSAISVQASLVRAGFVSLATIRYFRKNSRLTIFSCFEREAPCRIASYLQIWQNCERKTGYATLAYYESSEYKPWHFKVNFNSKVPCFLTRRTK